MTVIKTTSDVTLAPEASTSPDRNVWLSLKRGWKQTCPCCGTGRVYASYLKVNDSCPSCSEELHHQRADDAPPYFTMSIVAHIVVFGILYLEQNYTLDLWLQLAIWLPTTVLLSLWLLPRVKGALIGYQWANRMHGFGSGAFEGADLPPAEPQPADAR
jgi:uncharacterized protein (DUF983 family)